MPTWSELLEELKGQPAQSSAILNRKLHEYTGKVGEITGRNVLYYASGYLQKPGLSGMLTSISPEDINGFMAGVHGLDPEKGLLLMLHTPGGVVEASQTIVGYLRSKFGEIDALIPTYGMSAGTMIALGCDSITMGCHSQLGPIDPQLNVGNKQYSAHSVVGQFEEAKKDILADPNLAPAWNPVLSTLGPALLQQARRAIRYGESLVAEWLEKHMFAGRPDAAELAKKAAAYFGSDEHGSHGRRIDREDARRWGVRIVDLEDNQELQDAALTLYHLSTYTFENTNAAKIILSSNGRVWSKQMKTKSSPKPAGSSGSPVREG